MDTKPVGNEKLVAGSPEFKTGREHFSVYSNSANTIVSPWDFAFTFGEAVGINESTNAPIIEQRVTVKMSPQHTKAFLSVLSDNVRKYESLFGEIRWEPTTAEKEQIWSLLSRTLIRTSFV